MKRRSFDQCRARFISRACRADLSGVTRTRPQTVASTDKTDTSFQRLGSLEHRGEQTRESEHQRSEEEIPRSPFPSLSCAFNAVGATDNNISIDLFRSFERNRAIIFRAQQAKISNRRHRQLVTVRPDLIYQRTIQSKPPTAHPPILPLHGALASIFASVWSLRRSGIRRRPRPTNTQPRHETRCFEDTTAPAEPLLVIILLFETCCAL